MKAADADQRVPPRRLLFLKSGPYTIPTDIPSREKSEYLSRRFCGEIVAIVNEARYRRCTIGRFDFRGILLPGWVRYSSSRNVPYALFAVTRSVFRHWFRGKYDAIVTYDPLSTGLLGLLIRAFTGAKLIVEVNGNYEKAFTAGEKNIGHLEGLKQLASRGLLPFVLKRADGVKLVNHRQLEFFAGLKLSAKISAFPNFVPIRHFHPAEGQEKYILFMGFPWHLKGVDLLIKAFQILSPQFPDYTLRVVGYCPDKTEYERLKGDNSKIHLCEPVWYEEAIHLMSECSLFVLPSRTDSSPRVLREAMAARKPIVASNVDGIPDLIQDGYNGLLFTSEDHNDLAAKIGRVLTDQALAKSLAQNGFEYVYANLSEECYLERFGALVDDVCRR